MTRTSSALHENFHDTAASIGYPRKRRHDTAMRLFPAAAVRQNGDATMPRMGDAAPERTGETYEQMSDRLAAAQDTNAPLIAMDGRNRISLGKLGGDHRFFLATVFDSGQIMLTPCTLAAVGSPMEQEVEAARAAPTVKGRGRPQRKP